MPTTFAEYADLSIADSRILVELDIGSLNTQWVNNGAGIWAVDAENSYYWVDSTLVEEGFSAQDFGHIGSVQRDGIYLTEVLTLGALTDSLDSFYYDPDDRMLYVCLTGYNPPFFYDMVINVVYAYSYDSFTPAGNPPDHFEGRLLSLPSLSLAADPLFYGLLEFGGGSITLNNADGEFDTLAEDNEIYGNPARIYIGFDGLDYEDYERIYTGYIESFGVSQGEATITIADQRKSLTRPAGASMTAQTPISAIKKYFEVYYDLDYTSDHFDTSAFSAADAASSTYTISYGSTLSLYKKRREPFIEYIGQMCTAGFIVFWVDPDGKYTAKVVDFDATTADTIIKADDILNDFEVIYDPARVISSVNVGHSPVWTTSESQYTEYQDTSREASVYTAYKVYKEHGPVELPLHNASVATAWATKFMSVHSVVRGELEIEVPLIYYASNVGDEILVELERPQKTMIGTSMAYIKSKSWNLSDIPTIVFGIEILEG
jgi:hypothetical protein